MITSFLNFLNDAVKSPLNYICNSINSNSSLPSNDKLLEIKDDTKSDTNLDNDNDAN